MMDGHWFQADPKDYIIVVSRNSQICTLAISGNKQDFLILGNSFLRGYYSIHDMERGLLGLVPHSESTKSFPKKGIRPTQELGLGILGKAQAWQSWVIVTACMISFFLILFLAVFPQAKKAMDSITAGMFIGGISISFVIITVTMLVPHLNLFFLPELREKEYRMRRMARSIMEIA